MIRTLRSLVWASALATLVAAPVEATEYYGLDGNSSLWSIDDAGTPTRLGFVTGAPPFGFSVMDVAPNGTIYAVGPGLVTGFSVYAIDPMTLLATIVAGPVATSQTGGIGIAVDPTGTKAWVAGFIGLSTNVNFHEIDLTTGTATDRNNFGGNAWGLGFDADGSLFLTRQGEGIEAQVVEINQTDASMSTIIGTIPPTAFDLSLGVDLASDRGSGSIGLLSRATDEIYPLDTVGADVCGPGVAVIGFIGNLKTIGAIPEDAPTTTYFGIDGTTLYQIDASGGALSLGNVTGAPGGFGPIDVAPDGTLYAVSPGGISGFSIYTIDPNLLTATLVAGPFTTVTQTGGVGLAIHPSGNVAWVAGYSGLSFNLNFREIDLGTNTATDHGNFPGNSWGIAFDSAGSLFLARHGSGPVADLWEIDQTVLTNSMIIGQIPEVVDVSAGLDLASARSSGSLSLLSRANDEIFVLDSATACVGPKSTVIGIGNLRSIAERDACAGSFATYGAGCAGSGGFVPTLTGDGCPVVGNSVQFNISKGLGGASAILLFGAGQASIPVGGGCSLLINTVFPSKITLPLGGSGFGNGSITFFSPIPPIAAGFTIQLQAFVFDSGNPIGGAGTNGLQLSIAP